MFWLQCWLSGKKNCQLILCYKSCIKIFKNWKITLIIFIPYLFLSRELTGTAWLTSTTCHIIGQYGTLARRDLLKLRFDMSKLQCKGARAVHGTSQSALSRECPSLFNRWVGKADQRVLISRAFPSLPRRKQSPAVSRSTEPRHADCCRPALALHRPNPSEIILGQPDNSHSEFVRNSVNNGCKN